MRFVSLLFGRYVAAISPPFAIVTLSFFEAALDSALMHMILPNPGHPPMLGRFATGKFATGNLAPGKLATRQVRH